MSWGATAFTPIITYNTPPFGFAERSNPSDFSTCPQDPYSGSENLKNDIRHLFNVEKQMNPYSNFKEFFASEDNSQQAQVQSNIFSIYNVILFIIVMGILYYVTTKQIKML